MLYARLLACVPRAWTAVVTRNERALLHAIRDFEGYNKVLGYDYDVEKFQ